MSIRQSVVPMQYHFCGKNVLFNTCVAFGIIRHIILRDTFEGKMMIKFDKTKAAVDDLIACRHKNDRFGSILKSFAIWCNNNAKGYFKLIKFEIGFKKYEIWN